jgi:hypothetical protein
MASRRFDGAVTTPDDSGEVRDASAIPDPERPRRPIMIELASAILIVGGMTSVLGTVGFQLSGGESGFVGFLVLMLNFLLIVVGAVIRMGRAWILAINVVAIALFLEVTALPSAFAIVYGLMDAVVLIALLRYRWWFDWRPEDALARAAAARAVEASRDEIDVERP